MTVTSQMNLKYRRIIKLERRYEPNISLENKPKQETDVRMVINLHYVENYFTNNKANKCAWTVLPA